jgi:hypothetical protein
MSSKVLLLRSDFCSTRKVPRGGSVIPYLSHELIQTIVRPKQFTSKALQQQSGPCRGSSRPNHPEVNEPAQGISRQKFVFIAVALLKQWFASAIQLSIRSGK